MSWLKDYLSFSKRERNAFIGLLVIIAGFIFLPDLFERKKSPAVINDQVRKELAGLKNERPGNPSTENRDWQSIHGNPGQKEEIRLFEFDPNTLDEKGFITLGVPERTARTIINYRNKGGKFRKPDDLRKIYSLKREDADRIIPYISIAAGNDYHNPRYTGTYSKTYFSRTITPIDINTATIDEWKSLPGIGEILSARIVRFRETIGGFSAIEQVAKTYGLKDSTFQLIRPFLQLAVPAVNRININTASEKELLECNGMSNDVAKAIVIYRKQKGRFESLSDLKKIVFINEEMFNRVASCLEAK
jgi:competence protein ComEA